MAGSPFDSKRPFQQLILNVAGQIEALNCFSFRMAIRQTQQGKAKSAGGAGSGRSGGSGRPLA